MGSRNRDRMIPPIATARLRDVDRLDGALLATCGHCANARYLPLARLLARYGGDQLVKPLEGKLVCSRCGQYRSAITIKAMGR